MYKKSGQLTIADHAPLYEIVEIIRLGKNGTKGSAKLSVVISDEVHLVQI